MGERWLVGVTEYAGVTKYTGGIGRHYASLLPAVVRAGVDVDLVIFDAEDLVDERALDRTSLAGVRLAAHVRQGRVPTALLPLTRAAAFRRLLRRHRYDHVFAPEWGGLGSLLPGSTPLVTNLATSMRLSNIVSGLDPAAFPPPRRRIVAVQNWAEDRQIRRSRGLVPISRAMLARNRDLLGRLPDAVVVRNCIDVHEVQEASRTAALPASWPEGADPVVLFLGRLERRKGVVSAVEAFGRVLDEFPRARLVLAGAPGDRRFEPTRDHLLSTIPAAFRDRVVFLGHVPGPELYRAISSSTVVLCPSLWEGFGQVALEAKALGSALVVTTGSGYDDFCTDDEDCLMVPPGDSGRLTTAIGHLLGDSDLRRRLGRRAESGVWRFTADAVAPDLIDAVNRSAEASVASRSRLA